MSDIDKLVDDMDKILKTITANDIYLMNRAQLRLLRSTKSAIDNYRRGKDERNINSNINGQV